MAISNGESGELFFNYILFIVIAFLVVVVVYLKRKVVGIS
jgi:hypothetical protein